MANNRINWRECRKAFKSIFSFHGFKIIGAEYSGNTLTVTLNTTISPRCPQCGRFCHRYDEMYVRSVRDPDLSILSCSIKYPVPYTPAHLVMSGREFIIHERYGSKGAYGFLGESGGGILRSYSTKIGVYA